MTERDKGEEIDDDELLLRRIPAAQNWVSIDTKSVDPLAFRPRESDVSGLSFGRAKYDSPSQEAAKGARGRRFFVALLSVKLVREKGMTIVPKPFTGDLGHAEISDLTFANRRSDLARELVQCLRDCVVDIQGPFDGQRARQ